MEAIPFCIIDGCVAEVAPALTLGPTMAIYGSPALFGVAGMLGICDYWTEVGPNLATCGAEEQAADVIVLPTAAAVLNNVYCLSWICECILI